MMKGFQRFSQFLGYARYYILHILHDPKYRTLRGYRGHRISGYVRMYKFYQALWVKVSIRNPAEP